MDTTHLPERNLDVLRALAVACVALSHVLWACDRQLPIINDWELGRIGVLLFFVHTSLVLMSSLERGGTGQHWIRNFYVRRAFRIYPLAIAAVLVTVVFRIPAIVPATFTSPLPGTIATNLLLVQNLVGDRNVTGMLWTLPIEVQMYFVLPLLFLAARKSVDRVLIALALGGCIGLAVQYTSLPGLWRLSVGIFAPCFVSGVLAFAILRRNPQQKLPAWTGAPVLLAAVLIFIALRPTAERPVPGWIACVIIATALPFIANSRESALTRIAKTICTYSYGVYLLLTPILWIGFDLLSGRSPVVRWIGLVAALIAVPYIAYTVIERPGISLGKALVGRRGAADTPLTIPST